MKGTGSPKAAAIVVRSEVQSRARAGSEARSAMREQRVREAMALMADGRYVVGKTHRELAARWGISESGANHITGEAWRRHGAEITDPDRLRVKLAERLETVLDEAFQESRAPVSVIEGTLPDGSPRIVEESPSVPRRTVIDAAKVLGALLVTADGVIPAAWHTWSVEERWAAVDRAQQRLDEIRAGLPPRDGEEQLF